MASLPRDGFNGGNGAQNSLIKHFPSGSQSGGKHLSFFLVFAVESNKQPGLRMTPAKHVLSE